MADSDLVEAKRLIAGPLYKKRLYGSDEAKKAAKLSLADSDIVEAKRHMKLEKALKKQNSIQAILGRKAKSAVNKAKAMIMANRTAKAVNRRKAIE